MALASSRFGGQDGLCWCCSPDFGAEEWPWLVCLTQRYGRVDFKGSRGSSFLLLLSCHCHLSHCHFLLHGSNSKQHFAFDTCSINVNPALRASQLLLLTHATYKSLNSKKS